MGNLGNFQGKCLTVRPVARLPEKGGFSRHVPSPCFTAFTEIDLHEKVEVSQTPTLILERRKGSRNSEAKPQLN